jgi:WD40 repeat protein/serine/threonine protein kinase
MAEEQKADPNGRLTGRVLGGYVLRERLGNGGFGEVYRAEHLELRCTAVIKVMNEERRWKDDTAAARFRREAQLASRLRHPNAAQVYDFGVAAPEGEDDHEVMWIAMEFVDGVTFAKWLDAHGPMSLPEAVEFFWPLLKAVHAAHQCGIVHRDLKPSNVMVVESKDLDAPGAPVPKLIDFGIAKGSVENIAEDESVEHPGDKVATELVRATRSPRYYRTATDPDLPKLVPEHRRKITGSGFGVGSRPYTSPEQWGDAAKVTAAADIYSLGVMLCEALTRRLPILPLTADGSDGYRRAHLHGCPDIDLPEDVRRVLYRALSKDPGQRQANALELGTELRALVKLDPNAQIRSLAQRWHERGRSPDLLARGEMLLELTRSVQSQRVASKLSKLDDSFLKMSMQRARRAKWAIGALVALAVMSALVVRAEMRTHVAEMRSRMADQNATQNATESEIEQGRQALIHGESREAVRHLEQAYQRGDHSPGVVFMLARALQPRMSELSRFASSSGRMWSAMFALDGKRVLTTDDKAARMWDAESGQLLFAMSHGDTVFGAVFSPDGSRIITAGGDGTVRIWNAATGAPMRELRYQGSGAKKWRYFAVAMSSHFVAAIDLTGKAVHVWDAETGTQVAELGNDAAEMALVAFSADGHWLASSGRDEVRVFDTSTWRRASTIVGPRIRSLSFDPTGPRLAVGTDDGVASIWEVSRGVLMRCLRGAGASVDAVAFSRDGALVATASRDGTEQVWDSASGGLRAQFNSHHDMIYTVEFSSTGHLLLSAGADGAVVVSNVATAMPVGRLEGPKGRILAAHFDPESRRVVGASWDGTARVWDAASPYRRWGSPQIGAECDTMDSLVPDQRFVALSCRSHGTRILDTLRGELIAELPSVSTVEGDYFSALPALTSNGDRAAIARGNTVEVYALPSGQLLRTIVHPAAVNAVAFAPAGHALISGAVDGSLRLTNGEDDPIALPSSLAGIDAAAILADGRVVVADASDRLRVIGPGSNALLMDLAAPSRTRLLRPSPDGTRLITISIRSEQTPPLLWDLDQRRLVARLDGHVGRVFTARFIAEGGHEVLTAGSDGTVRLWDATTGSPRQVFRGDSHSLADAALAPDGSVIVAGGSDGFLRFWDTSNGRLLWTLQAHSSFVIGVHWEDSEFVTRGRAGDVARWALPSPDKVIEACHARTCAAPTLAEK